MNRKDMECDFRHDNASTIEITKIKTLQNKTLLNYLEIRGIPSQIAAQYVKEATWRKINAQPWDVKRYYGIAVKNDKGGLELSYGGEGWNQSLSKKPHAITTIPGNNETLELFDSIYDFLSFLIFNNMKSISGTAIICNKGSNINDLINKANQYKRVNIYLPNDEQGVELSNIIQKKHPAAENQSIRLFPGLRTFNEFLLKEKFDDSG